MRWSFVEEWKAKKLQVSDGERFNCREVRR
jgi:hypothetical protein